MLTNWSHHKGSSTWWTRFHCCRSALEGNYLGRSCQRAIDPLTAHKQRNKVYSREEYVQSEECMPLLGVSQSISISPHSQKV